MLLKFLILLFSLNLNSMFPTVKAAPLFYDSSKLELAQEISVNLLAAHASIIQSEGTHYVIESLNQQIMADSHTENAVHLLLKQKNLLLPEVLNYYNNESITNTLQFLLDSYAAEILPLESEWKKALDELPTKHKKIIRRQVIKGCAQITYWYIQQPIKAALLYKVNNPDQ